MQRASPCPLVKAAVTAAQQRVREGRLAPDALLDAVLADLPLAPVTLRPVLNATGVLLHTNLGRAPLSPAARDALAVAAGTVTSNSTLRPAPGAVGKQALWMPCSLRFPGTRPRTW
jgi:hypothetical protein